MIATLDELIDALTQLRAKHGGATPVGIEDADTRWSLAVKTIVFDSNEQRVLVSGDEVYGESHEPR